MLATCLRYMVNGSLSTACENEKRCDRGKHLYLHQSQEMVMKRQGDSTFTVGVSLLGASPDCFDWALALELVSTQQHLFLSTVTRPIFITLWNRQKKNDNCHR